MMKFVVGKKVQTRRDKVPKDDDEEEESRWSGVELQDEPSGAAVNKGLILSCSSILNNAAAKQQHSASVCAYVTLHGSSPGVLPSVLWLRKLLSVQ